MKFSRVVVFGLCVCGVLSVWQHPGSATLAGRFQVTPDGTAYTYSYSDGTVTVTAPSTSGGNDREFFWASNGITESNTTACATFSGGQDFDQPGIALRIADDGNEAVTVTENIFSSGGSPRNQFNFDTWNTADDPAFTEFGTASVSGLPSSPATWPLNMCAQITGNLVQFVVWTSGTQPAWGNPQWGGQAILPSNAPFSGQTGFYVGHLTPGTSLEYSDLTVDGLTTNPTPSHGYWLVGSDGGSSPSARLSSTAQRAASCYNDRWSASCQRATMADIGSTPPMVAFSASAIPSSTVQFPVLACIRRVRACPTAFMPPSWAWCRLPTTVVTSWWPPTVASSHSVTPSLRVRARRLAVVREQRSQYCLTLLETDTGW